MSRAFSTYVAQNFQKHDLSHMEAKLH